MASSSSSGDGQCDHNDDIAGDVFQANRLGIQPGNPVSERVQGIPRALPATAAMEPTSKLHSVAAWVLGYLRYTCVVLGYLATCLRSVEMQEGDEEANMTSNGVNREQSVHMMDGNNDADRDCNLESKHKVFLSHSGAQKDFVEQLCVDLERCDRYPFFDKRRSSLPIGEKFPKLIFDAVKQCQVGVVVLSKEFFMKSKWPMLELNAMVKELKKPITRIKIIPVFYHISIDEFKDSKIHSQWKSQWKQWCREDKRIKVEEWEEALRVVCSIHGLVLKEGCSVVKFREEIVREIRGKVSSETRWDDSHVQGRSRTCKVIQDKMDRVSASSTVCIVGLYGMGGIGKTTICKALCNDFALNFCDNVCHIEFGSGSDLELLRKALKKLSEIRHDVLDKLDDIELESTIGCAYLRKKLCTQRVFLALDNVQDDYKSLEVAQAYLKAGYGCGSVVLVTARSLNVLKKLNLNESNCLEMPELEEDEAKTLFLNYADLPSTNKIDEEVLENCIERCHFQKGDGRSEHYHPLALRVLGQQLGWDYTKWAAQLCNIDTFNQLKDTKHPVFSILRNSFDSLDRKHQLVFMDLALLMTVDYDNPEFGMARRDWLCLVHEEDMNDMKDMLELLKRKSLLEDLTDDFTEIGMHDLWIEFAVAETKAQDTIDQRWVYQVDGKKALGRSGRGRESVERMCFMNEGWKGLKGLNLADFVNVEAFKLEVEVWELDCTLDLDLVGLKHLKSLELDTPGLKVRVEGLSSLTNLGYLYWITPRFSPSLDGIERLTNLQNLELWGCKGIEVLDLTELKFLRTAEVNRCPHLIAVRGLSSRMADLRFLRIPFCKSLRECTGVGELHALEMLVLMGCGKLEELPCLVQLTKLREFVIEDCKLIRAVPGLSDLVGLEILYASGCSELATLADLAKLTKLRELNIQGCPVEEVVGLDGLLSLTSLRASLGKLSGVLPGLSGLSALTNVFIEGWNGPIWSIIQNLAMLEELQLYDCKGEDVVPDLQRCDSLKGVWLLMCECKDLLGLSNSTALETLRVGVCDKLERLPVFERLTKLTDLAITDCDNLRDWQSESTLCSLISLEVDGSSLSIVVRDLEALTALRILRLWDSECENVLSMASLMSQLETVAINRFSKMEELDVSIFCQVEELELWGCRALKRVTCRIPLTSLMELRVIHCGSLVEMPDLSRFPQLEELRLEKCRAIKRLSCSERLTALRKIEVIGCDRVVEMPGLSRFPELRDFIVEEASSSDGDEVGDNSDGDFSDEDDDGDDCEVVDLADDIS